MLNNSNYYTLLNCGLSSTSEQINTEFKLLALTYHPDKNPKYSKEKFEELITAKTVLLNPYLRQRYDQYIKSGMSISFDKYIELTKFGAIHWIPDNNSKMILNTKNDNIKSTFNEEITDTQKLFRSYQI
ncbi:unnamed protein product [Gordionus sp. m RMFG-2023]|uniref:dnaJ homolog subfamily C member 12-like isoform X2 n=1 Tax=Gordionus sp. m RMFG-2023 TaxID=3053472 RepID=UPI0030DFA468